MNLYTYLSCFGASNGHRRLGYLYRQKQFRVLISNTVWPNVAACSIENVRPFCFVKTYVCF